MRTGELSSRGRIQRPVETPDGMGGTTVQWTDVATVWVKRTPGNGREFWNVQHAQPSASHVLTIRYRADVLVSWRMIIGTAVYRVLASAEDQDVSHRWLILTCEEQVVCE